MANNKGLGLPQTRGTFQIRAITTGTERDSFYSEKLTKTGKQFRMTNFGLTFAPDQTVYGSLNGMVRDDVYFYSSKEKKTEKVIWTDRFNFKKEGYAIMGVSLGLRKVKDEVGKEVNDRKRLVEFDACKEIYDNMKDGMSVFARGTIEFSTFNDRHQTRFTPSQISLCQDIDFDSPDYSPMALFTQTIVFMGIEPTEDKTRAIVSAKIVNFSTIEDAEFIIENMELAKQFKKNLKPYTSIQVSGYIKVSREVEEVDTDDCWGEVNKMEVVSHPTVRELIITGATPSSIDKETYSEKAMDEAIAAMKASSEATTDFGGSNNDWGSGAVLTTDDEDDDEPW